MANWFPLSCMTIAMVICAGEVDAAEPQKPPTSSMYTIALDPNLPKNLMVRLPYPSKSPDIDPDAKYLLRARALQAKLRERFGSRVTLSEIDLVNQPGKIEFGLRITAGPAKDLARFAELSEVLGENEVIVAIQSGGFREAGLLDDACLRQVAALDGIRRLKLYQCSITAAAWQSIGRWKQLETLIITEAPISGDAMAVIGTLTGLKDVTFDRTNISDADLAAFISLKRLERLQLYQCKNVGDMGVSALRELTGITFLELSDTRVTDAGIKQLSGLTRLTYLGLGNTAITDQCLLSLANMKEMSCLVLDGTSVTGSTLGALTKMPLLSQLQLQNTQLTGENWMKFVPQLDSYDKGLMFLTKGSKITSAEAERIRKMAIGQTFLNGKPAP